MRRSLEEQDPDMVRARRTRRKNDDRDEQEDIEDSTFKSNPLDAINRHSKQSTEKNIEKQVSYFGNAIEPFHMRDYEQLGDVDEDGFFVFNRKNRVRDAWLDTVGEAEDADVADHLVKKIKEGGRFQSVYEAGEQLNRNLPENEEEDDDKDSYEGGGIEEAPQSEEESDHGGLSIEQLIEIMVDLIPDNSNANNYMKKLKKANKLEEYQKLLTISDEYIRKSGEYDILTKKKDELQEMLDEILQSKKKKLKLVQEEAKVQQQQQQPIENWDEGSEDSPEKLQGSEKPEGGKQVEQNESDSEGEDNDEDNDNIF